jgi:hypothetical protein
MLEVHIVPKRQDPGYMWSFIWTIELTSRQTEEMLQAILTSLPPAQVHAMVRRVIKNTSRRNQPFGPGSLEDYDLIEGRTTIRFALTPE